MIEAAVAVTTGRLHLDSPQQARALLLSGDERATGYFRHELGRQIGTALLMTDPQVIGVFEEQDVPASEEESPPVSRLEDPMRLIVLAASYSYATEAFINAICDALRHILGDAVTPQPSNIIQVQIVTDASSDRLQARVRGYRPAPVLLAARDDGIGWNPAL